MGHLKGVNTLLLNQDTARGIFEAYLNTILVSENVEVEAVKWVSTDQSFEVVIRDASEDADDEA